MKIEKSHTMNRASVFRVFGLGVALIACSAAPTAVAQEWAEKMFNKLEHDFGTVARGADTVYRFEITNLYKQPMKITSVTSSCGCTSPTIENESFKTYEKSYIVAKFNTHTHVGRKGATLTVRFAPPYQAKYKFASMAISAAMWSLRQVQCNLARLIKERPKSS